ncbi:MAG TPA: tryptophan synthase subunit alpha [Propionibacteriaceae bacterium]|nr:tryptophan synthase subunit alpha [Propionibacteriaceae bacterium]
MTVDPGHTGQLLLEARNQGRGALAGFLHVGYPTLEISLRAFKALTGEGVESPGVDLVEVGIPYSDPVMDGVTIQRAGTKALERGVRTRDVFAAVEAVANSGTPALVMTYWNLVERYGADRFARDLASAGGAGAITPDLTPDEAAEWISVSDDHGLDRVFLVSPSSTEERLAATVAACRGWVYATSLMGVTGTRAQTSAAAPELVHRVRGVDSSALVGVGLGVSNGVQAREVAGFADLVIVGSALVKTVLDAEDAGRSGDLSGLRALVADLAAGVRAGDGVGDGEPSLAASAGPTESGTSQRSPGLVGT